MTASQRMISLGFTTERLPEGRHICYIYSDDEERRRTMAKYLQSGLQDGEKVLYLVDTMSPEEFREAMAELGIELDQFGDAMNVARALPAYCPNGHFSCPDMLEVVGDFYRQAIEEKFQGARGTGEMSWALVEDCTDIHDLMEYEARLNQVLQQFPYTACCQYDARLFDGATILDVLSVHPLMIVRGQLVHNPFYVEPEDFLRRLNKKRTS